MGMSGFSYDLRIIFDFVKCDEKDCIFIIKKLLIIGFWYLFKSISRSKVFPLKQRSGEKNKMQNSKFAIQNLFRHLQLLTLKL